MQSYEIREAHALMLDGDTDAYIIALRASFAFSQRNPRLQVASYLLAKNIEDTNTHLAKVEKAFVALNCYQ